MRYFALQLADGKGGWRRMPFRVGTEFASAEEASAYGEQYHAGKYRVVRITETFNRAKLKFVDQIEEVW